MFWTRYSIYTLSSFSSVQMLVFTSWKSSHSQRSAQIIHKLHLAPANRQHHEALSCFVALSTTLPLAGEKGLIFVLFGWKLPVFKAQGQRVSLFEINVLCCMSSNVFHGNEAMNGDVHAKLPHCYMTTVWYKELLQSPSCCLKHCHWKVNSAK